MSSRCLHCNMPVTEDEAVQAGNLDASAHPECQEAADDSAREAEDHCPTNPACCDDCSTHEGCHCGEEHDEWRH